MDYRGDSLYKLMILALLRHSRAPLSGGRIVNFFLDGSYTDYFTVQAALHELLEDRLVKDTRNGISVFYTLTEEGETSCAALEGSLDPGIREEILSYLKTNAEGIITDASTRSRISRGPDGSFLVRMEALEAGRVIFALELSLPDRKSAEEAAAAWPARAASVYRGAASSLFEDAPPGD